MSAASRRTRYRALFAVYFFSYSGVAVYRNVFLEDLGMDGTQMGVIGFAFVIVGVAAQPAWGVVTDWRGAQKRVLVLGAVGSGLGLSLYLVGPSVGTTFGAVLVGTVVYSLFRAPIVPVANSLVLSEGFEYGRVRAFGSAAFGIGSAVIGFALAAVETGSIVIVYLLGMGVIVGVVSRTRIEQPPISNRLGGKVRSLLARRDFVVLALVALALAMSTSAASAFFSVYMRQVTGGDTLTGVAWAVKTAFEAAAFLYLFRFDLRYRTVLFVGAVAAAVPSFLYAATSSVWVVLAAQSFAGLGYAMYYLATVNLAHALAPADLASTAQTAVAAFGLGIGGAVGQLLAGRVLDVAGIRSLYIALGAVALVGAVGTVFVTGQYATHETGSA